MSSVPAVQEFEVGREFVLESCVNVPEGLVGRTRGESPSDDSSGILHATDPPPSEPQTDSPLPSLLVVANTGHTRGADHHSLSTVNPRG